MRTLCDIVVGAAGVVAAIAVGCTSTNPGAANDAGTDGGPAPNTSATSDAGTTDAATADAGMPGSLSCFSVLQCAGRCPDANVDACVQGCVDQTSPRSKPVTEAFVQCLTSNNCGDADCVRAKCASELDACIADDATAAGEPTTGPTPTGAVPANLVGLWSSVGTTSGTSYDFAADGATTQVYKNATSLYCDSEIDVTSSGVTVVSGDSLVYHRVSGTQGMKSCGKTTSKSLGPADLTYRYVLGTTEDGTAKLSLYLVDDNGSVSTTPVELHR